jgi:hypothetical protein
MLGLRPSTTGIYQNSPWFRSTAANKNRISLTQYFGAHGYETQTAGKIFHGSRMDGPSFEIVGERPGQRLAIDKQLVSDIGSKSRLWDYGAQTYPEEKFVDHVVADWAIKSLGEKKKKPFFLAAGFYRPHVPTYAPLRFFDRLPLKGINLPLTRQTTARISPPTPSISWPTRLPLLMNGGSRAGNGMQAYRPTWQVPALPTSKWAASSMPSTRTPTLSTPSSSFCPTMGFT